jgi:hypothetical protein
MEKINTVVPKDSILRHETALKADHFVVVAHGTLDEVTTPKRIPGEDRSPLHGRASRVIVTRSRDGASKWNGTAHR